MILRVLERIIHNIYALSSPYGTRIIRIFFYILLALPFSQVNAQYKISEYDGQQITTCSGTFYDSGGLENHYSSGEDYTITFCSDLPNSFLSIDFTDFNLENNSDILEVFYGNSTTGNPDFVYTNLLNPFRVSEQSENGCISFRFRSDTSVNNPGWIGEISCLTPCIAPVAVIADDSTVNVCQDDIAGHTITVDGSNSYSMDNYAIVNYIWSWGDGTTTTTTSPIATHTYANEPAIYNIQLTVSTDNTSVNPEGCLSTNAAIKQINIIPPPTFEGTSASPQTVNCGQSIQLEGIASSQTVTSETPAGIGSDVVLPDTTQVPFESTIDFTDYFAPGATFSEDCLPEITLNLEHSYGGDLEIILIAPSGEAVVLFDGYSTSSINSNFFGYCAQESDGTGPGCPAPYNIVNDGGLEWTDAAGYTTMTSICDEYNGACQSGDYFVPNGTFNSYEPLTNLNGAQLNGVWTIRIIDNLPRDDGYLSSWSMNFPFQCIYNLDFVTPLLTDLTWSHDGTGPDVTSSQSFTNEVYETVGIDPCPTGEVCDGNQLSNNITLGPFGQTGDYVYTLTAVDEFGCTYSQDVTISVEPGEVVFNDFTNTYCLNDEGIPDLPSTSSNGIEGSWSPSSIDTSILGETTYTFTPTDLMCAPAYELVVTIDDIPNTSEISYD